jgi:hypothetical protein
VRDARAQDRTPTSAGGDELSRSSDRVAFADVVACRTVASAVPFPDLLAAGVPGGGQHLMRGKQCECLFHGQETRNESTQPERIARGSAACSESSSFVSRF